jgi:hypothetical protein
VDEHLRLRREAVGSPPRLLLTPRAFADSLGALEVGEHQNVEELGAGGGTEGVEPLAQDPFELLKVHEANASTRE